MSKNNILALIITVVVLTAVAMFGTQFAGSFNMPEAEAAAVTPTPLPATTSTQTQPAASSLPRTITVVGQGSISAAPDIATVVLGVNVSAATVEQAMEDASNRMDKIMAALKKLNIADKDITTSNYSIYYEEPPRYEMPAVTKGTEGTGETPAGVYRVSNMVTVKIRKLDQVGELIDAAVSAGANSLWGVNFDLEDRTELEAKARAKAVENARLRAEELAKLAGVKVGGVVQISEVIGTGGYYPMPSAPRAAAAEMGGGAGPISPGELEISYQIQVTFELQ